MKHPYAALVIADSIFFSLFDASMLQLLSNASLAVFAVLPVILIAYVIFLVVHGIVSYKITQSVFYPHIVFLIFLLVSYVVFAFWTIAHQTTMDVTGMMIALLFSFLISWASSLITKVVVHHWRKIGNDSVA